MARAALTTWHHHRELWDKWKEGSGEGDGETSAASDARTAFIEGLLRRSQQEGARKSSVQAPGDSEAKGDRAGTSSRRQHRSPMVHLKAVLYFLVTSIMLTRD